MVSLSTAFQELSSALRRALAEASVDVPQLLLEDLSTALKDSLDELVEAAGGRTTKPRRRAATPRKLEPA